MNPRDYRRSMWHAAEVYRPWPALHLLNQLQANPPHIVRIRVGVFLLRLADKRADGLLLAALHVGDDFGIRRYDLLADGLELAGIDFADSQSFHRLGCRPL